VARLEIKRIIKNYQEFRLVQNYSVDSLAHIFVPRLAS